MSAVHQLLKTLVEAGASDVHLRADSPPLARIGGKIQRVGEAPVTPEQTERLCRELMPRARMWEDFEATRETDFAFSLAGVARFRVNAYWQRGTVGMIMRVIQPGVPTFEQLGLPRPVLQDIAGRDRGLFLVTGPTGSGKTTTIASMLDHINGRRAVNVVTLEDPIEYVHEDRMAVFNQRELGTDTLSYASGLRAAVRQDPDVIVIGEMRDQQTVEAALSAAQTGHLVLSTLHTLDAMRSVNRVIDFFAPHERDQVRLALSQTLLGVVSQRLLPGAGGEMVLGHEVLLGTPTVREAIRDESKSDHIKEALLRGEGLGMHTFDQHLARLVMSGRLDVDAALEAATSPHELKVMLMQAGAA